ncbi:uncharacterized protein KY384_004999 [Bacidia gigantensis]|uniref:uncharacterized protein n=1 Tax=Bacidia gigantensis TaxID=2732470 RepID=UPI001D04A789|nr:uncharacterized protein KY384_004999 [Bacidia gigantensis]KAG8530496.1 hypothetical protein KY384_004999 [Bacidia gigantensis]
MEGEMLGVEEVVILVAKIVKAEEGQTETEVALEEEMKATQEEMVTVEIKVTAEMKVIKQMKAVMKVKRSLFSNFLGDRLVKRAEEVLSTINPLKDALSNFGADKQGKSFISSAMDSAEGIITNKFPKDKPNSFVTGLEGHYTLAKKLTIGTAENKQTFQSGTRLYWAVRWDYDPVKGPHVNAMFSGKPGTCKFAYNLDKSKFLEGDEGGKKAMLDIAQDLNKQCKYSMAKNMGKDKPEWDTTEEQAMEDLKNHFKTVGDGPCT